MKVLCPLLYVRKSFSSSKIKYLLNHLGFQKDRVASGITARIVKDMRHLGWKKLNEIQNIEGSAR